MEPGKLPEPKNRADSGLSKDRALGRREMPGNRTKDPNKYFPEYGSTCACKETARCQEQTTGKNYKEQFLFLTEGCKIHPYPSALLGNLIICRTWDRVLRGVLLQ